MCVFTKLYLWRSRFSGIFVKWFMLYYHPSPSLVHLYFSLWRRRDPAKMTPILNVAHPCEALSTACDDLNDHNVTKKQWKNWFTGTTLKNTILLFDIAFGPWFTAQTSNLSFTITLIWGTFALLMIIYFIEDEWWEIWRTCRLLNTFLLISLSLAKNIPSTMYTQC